MFKKSVLSSVHKLDLFEQILEAGYIEFSPDGEAIFFSAGLARLCGFDSAESSLATLGRAIHPGDRAAFCEDIAILRRRQVPPDRVYRINHTGATARYISLHLEDLMTEAGGCSGFFGVFRDVTDREIQRRARAERDRRVEALLQFLAVDCIWYADGSGQMFEHLATSRLQGILPSFDALSPAIVHPDDCDVALPTISRAIATGTPVSVYLRIKGNDDLFRRYHKRGIPIRAEDGTVTEWWGVIVEVHDTAERGPHTADVAEEVIDLTTGPVVRGVCAFMGWTHNELASRSNLSETTITRFCATLGVLVGSFRRKSVEAVVKSFAKEGVNFTITDKGFLSVYYAPRQ